VGWRDSSKSRKEIAFRDADRCKNSDTAEQHKIAPTFSKDEAQELEITRGMDKRTNSASSFIDIEHERRFSLATALRNDVAARVAGEIRMGP